MNPSLVILAGVGLFIAVRIARAAPAIAVPEDGGGEGKGELGAPGATPLELLASNPVAFAGRPSRFMVRKDLSHGGRYQPQGQNFAELAREHRVSVQAVTAGGVQEHTDGRLYTWLWGPRVKVKPWVELRLRWMASFHGGNPRETATPQKWPQAAIQWDGTPVCISEPKKATGRWLLNAFRGLAEGVDPPYLRLARLDVPRDDEVRVLHYKDVANLPEYPKNTPSTVLYRVLVRVFMDQAPVSLLGYQSAGVTWILASETANWKGLRDQSSNVEYLFSRLGYTAYYRTSNSAGHIVPRERLRPYFEGSSLSAGAQRKGSLADSPRAGEDAHHRLRIETLRLRILSRMNYIEGTVPGVV